MTDRTLQRITFNLSGNGVVRTETMEGKEYLVAPVVMITEGVHNGHGKNGPVSLLYTGDELSKTARIWNYKPIVVYHPDMATEGETACNPLTLSTRKVGVVLNTYWDTATSKLRAEAWIDKEKANEVDSRVLESIQNNILMEVSTGLFAVHDETAPGVWNGESYNAIARQIGPDHLALLPDLVGACSIADGAGLLQLNQQAKQGGGAFARAVEKVLASMGVVAEEGEAVNNEMSADNVRKALYDQLDVRFGYGAWIEDHYPKSNFVIYQRLDKLWKLSYSVNGNEVVLGDETPVEVTKVTEYRTLSGEFVGNQKEEKDVTKKTDEKKLKVVESLITNENCGWEESDREFLLELDDTKLAKLVPPEPVQNEDKGAKKKEAEKKKKEEEAAKPVTNEQDPMKVFQEYVANAPPMVQEVILEGHKTLVAERKRLVGEIVANESNVFTEDELLKMQTDHLRKIAAIGAKSSQSQTTQNQQGQVVTDNDPMGVFNYFGLAGARVDNDHEEEALSIPDVFAAVE